MLYAILKPLAVLLMRLLFRVEARGTEHVPAEGAVLIVANHSSFLDPPLVGGMADETRKNFGAPRGEGEGAEERMEDWFKEDAKTSEFEEGEVVRGRVVHVGSSEVLVDVG